MNKITLDRNAQPRLALSQDTINEYCEAIIDGDMLVSLGGDAKGMHGIGVLLAFDAINGNRQADGEKVIHFAPPVVNIDNAQEYYDANFTNYEPRPWDEWSITLNPDRVLPDFVKIAEKTEAGYWDLGN